MARGWACSGELLALQLTKASIRGCPHRTPAPLIEVRIRRVVGPVARTSTPPGRIATQPAGGGVPGKELLHGLAAVSGPVDRPRSADPEVMPAGEAEATLVLPRVRPPSEQIRPTIDAEAAEASDVQNSGRAPRATTASGSSSTDPKVTQARCGSRR
ncbi:hypothetical protein ACFY1U_43060 [Streptomyces sp. NPDC001351]|uniref:hypothetical protein n=1 Tax=Streptomyces sp. NPDC001351 TaxID=3364564 RepID=UPI0036C4D56C